MEEPKAFSAEERRLSAVMKPLAALNFAAWLMMIPARPEMVLQVTKGNALLASQILGSMTAGASLVEFLFTPLLGILSDKYGRKPFLVLCPAVGCVARLVTFAGFQYSYGTLASVALTNLLDRSLTGACGGLFITSLSASASDVMLGPKLSRFWSTLTGYTGLAVMAGPWLGAQIVAATGNPGYVCLAASATSALTVAWALLGYTETLAPAERARAVSWRKANPLSFLGFLRLSPAIRKLSALVGLQSFPNDMHDTKMVLNKTVLGFDARGVGHYMLASGLYGIGSGYTGRATLRLGAAAHTHLCHLLAACGNAGWAFARSFPHVLGAMACEMVGNARTHATRATLTSHGIAAGLGRGEVAAGIAQMANLTKVFGPLTFALLFARLGQRAPFFLAAGMIAAAEALLLSIARADFELESAAAPLAAAAGKR
jgi:DHA1 family tetracycline resistance protein-like MFS transporter